MATVSPLHRVLVSLFCMLAILLAIGTLAPLEAEQTSPTDERASIPAAEVVNPDGTLNASRNTGALDLAGWHVSLDQRLGPILAPLNGGGAEGAHSHEGGVPDRASLAAEQWSRVGNGTNGNVNAIAVSGGVVYVGGDFTRACADPTCATVGTRLNHIAKWDGTAWSSLGNGLDDTVNAIAVRSGVVFAGGRFSNSCDNITCSSATTEVNHIARWNGSAWSPLGMGVNGFVFAIALRKSPVSIDTELYAGGQFTHVCGTLACTASNTRVNYIARWVSGTNNWVRLGYGVNGPVFATAIKSPFTLNPGHVFAGGYFSGFCQNLTCSSFTPLNRIGEWNGSAWSSLDHGLNSEVDAIAISGSDVYAGGAFLNLCWDSSCTLTSTRVNYIAKWNGSKWSALDKGLSGHVKAIAVSGSDLYVAGRFLENCGNSACNNGNSRMNHIAKWTVGAWSPLAHGLQDFEKYTAYAIALNGSAVEVGGTFRAICGDGACTNDAINTPARHLAKYGP